MTPRHAILDVNHEVFPALLVLYGDVGVFVGNGVVQSAADTLLLPLAASQPELFTQSQPVLSAQWQGIALAALWAGFTMALNGYRPSATRTLPSRAAFIPLCAAWFGSSVVLLSTCAGLGLHSRLRGTMLRAACMSCVALSSMPTCHHHTPKVTDTALKRADAAISHSDAAISH